MKTLELQYTMIQFLIMLLITHIIFILVRFFLGDTIALLRESYTFLHRRFYVSSINLIKLKLLEFDE